MSSLKSKTTKDLKKNKSILPKKPAKMLSPAPNLSTEFVEENDLKEDENLEEASTSDDEESLPDNPALPAPKGKAKTAVTAAGTDSGSGSESESAEDSDSEDAEDEGEKPSNTGGKSSVDSISANTSSATKTVSFKAPQYKPPPGYESASIGGSSSTSQLFQNYNLEGKQIWYITAPASVPLSSIKEASLAKIELGSLILSHNGNKYGLVQDSSEDVTYTKVMIPNSAEDGYCTATKSIDRIVKMKEIVQLPSVYNTEAKEAGSSTSDQATVLTKKPVRPQPPGLKMRFRPIGFGDGKLGKIGSSSPLADGKESTSDAEMEDAPRQFRRPASLEQEESSTSSHDESSSSSDAEMADAPPLKIGSAVDSKSKKSAAKEAVKVTSQSLKRKASEGGDIKAKNSSSSSATSTNRQLNTVKKKQKSSPAASQSVSTEAHKTASPKLPHSAKSPTSIIPPPKPKHSRSSSHNSSQIPAPFADIASSRPLTFYQISPPRKSPTSITHETFSQASDMQSHEPPRRKAQIPVLEPELSGKEVTKEAKRLKKDKSKLLSLSNVPEPGKSQDDVVESSSQAQDLLGDALKLREKQKSTDPKKGKKKREIVEIDKSGRKEKKKRITAEYEEGGREEQKKRKTTELDNGKAKEEVSRFHSSTPILPPKRSLSTIPPPNSTSLR